MKCCRGIVSLGMTVSKCSSYFKPSSLEKRKIICSKGSKALSFGEGMGEVEQKP